MKNDGQWPVKLQSLILSFLQPKDDGGIRAIGRQRPLPSPRTPKVKAPPSPRAPRSPMFKHCVSHEGRHSYRSHVRDISTPNWAELGRQSSDRTDTFR